MSNQRSGKTHRAALGDGMQDMKLRNFFRTCAELIEDEDAAYYFEQVVDHLNSGGSLPSEKSEISRILGL